MNEVKVWPRYNWKKMAGKCKSKQFTPIRGAAGVGENEKLARPSDWWEAWEVKMLIIVKLPRLLWLFTIISGGKRNWRRMNKVPYWVIHHCQGGLSGELKDRSMSLFLPSTDTAVKIHVIVAAIHGHQVQGKVVVRVEGVLSLILMSLLLSTLLSSGPRKSLLESGWCLLLSSSSHLPCNCPCQTLPTPLCASHRSGEWILNI